MKIKNIIAIMTTSIAALMVTFSGFMKVIKFHPFQIGLDHVGVGKYIVLLGATEIVIIALFVYPKTMKAGLLLASCYFSGAIATELSHGTTIAWKAALPLILIWTAAFFRDRLIFRDIFKRSDRVVF